MIGAQPLDTVSENVTDFFDGKTVFVTGVTGYLGKALIEKILYSCRNIKKIYVLLRDKEGERACDRVKQIINSSAFDRVKNRDIKDLDKIKPMSGDVRDKDLGLSKENLEILREEVSVVFHLAATVNFNEPLKDALIINVNGTQEVMTLCRQVKKLQAFIHVSTAFSNADLRRIDEMVYPNKMDLHHVKTIAECFSNDDYIIRKLLGTKPNTYTFTKALAEEIIMKERGDLPVAIIRPSIVISALKEPSAGWIDNWNGSTGLFVGLSTGVMKFMIGKGDNVTDLVPLDIVINLIIVVAANCQRSSLTVYNCCTGKSNPITCNQAETIARRVTYKHALHYVPFPFMMFISNTILYHVLRFVFQLVPSYLADLWLLLNGKRAIQLNIQRKISRTVDLMKYFLLNEWYFEDANVRNLLTTISKTDRETFNFDVKSINWDKCLEDYVLGTRKHLVKISRRSDKGKLQPTAEAN